MKGALLGLNHLQGELSCTNKLLSHCCLLELSGLLMWNERKAKTLKHDILSKKRNKLSDDQAITLYGMSENLCYLYKARKDVVDKMFDSAVGYLPSNLNASLD